MAISPSRSRTSIHDTRACFNHRDGNSNATLSANWIIGYWLGVVTTPRRIPLRSPTQCHSALKCSRASIWIQLIQLKNNPSQALLWETLLREVSSPHEFIQQHQHSAASSSVLQSNVKWELIPLLFSFGIASRRHFFKGVFTYTAVECNLGRVVYELIETSKTPRLHSSLCGACEVKVCWREATFAVPKSVFLLRRRRRWGGKRKLNWTN